MADHPPGHLQPLLACRRDHVELVLSGSLHVISRTYTAPRSSPASPPSPPRVELSAYFES